VYRYDDLIGSWPALVARLDASAVSASWGVLEPRLAGLDSVADLARVTARDAAPEDREAVFDGLVSLAAVSGAGDTDAALVATHLLIPGARTVAYRLTRLLRGGHHDLAARMPEFVIGELMSQIRAFPVQRRGHRCAARLLWATHDAVQRELAMHIGGVELPMEPSILLAHADRPSACAADDVDVWGFLAWAVQRAVLAAADAALLRDLATTAAAEGPGARLRVAQRHGVSERTVRRRRDRALAALRSARDDYLTGAEGSAA
jgi:hypothetical protein